MVYSFTNEEENRLYKRIAITLSVLLLISPLSSSAESSQDGDSLSARAVTAPADSARGISIGLLMLRTDERFRSAMMLPFYSRSGINTHTMLGYRVYRASMYECALQGAGAGMTMGVAAGAFGMMTGAWDERKAWYIAGAAAAVGAILGTAKSDDPSWNIRIRWDPDR
jgi:hypothetical protein